MKRRIKIAIDGPAASGKSTTAKIIANELGYLYIDTGAMYRALTLAVLDHKINVADKQAIIDLAKKIHIELREGEDGLNTFLDGKDVSREIRLPIISEIISRISAYAEVREIMVHKQRQLAQSGGIVMDGRDIGTIVLPEAEVKIFMQASIAERARRRYRELKKKGMNVQLLQIKEEIRQRDYIDSSRETSPLTAASDAHIVDTTGLSIKKQVEKIMEIIKTIYLA
jgi:cytidylate kinase